MSNGRFALFIFLIIVFIGLLVVNDIRWNIRENDQTQITLVTQAKYGEEWEKLIEGARQAANEFGVEVKLLAPDDARTFEEQARLLQTIQAQSTDGVILSPIAPYDQSAAIIEMSEMGIPILTAVTPLDHINLVKHVGTNQYELGQALGRLIYADYGDGATVAIVSLTADKPEMMLREEGLRDYLGNRSGFEVLNTWYSPDDIYSATKTADSILIGDRADIIVSLNLNTTLGVAQAIDLTNKPIAVYGIDASTEIIDYMDQDIVKGLVTNNYFAMGYLAVEEMVKHIEDFALLTGSEVKPYVVTKENLYSKASQMILFPIK